MPDTHVPQNKDSVKVHHYKTKKGWFCEYHGEDLKGVGAFGDSPEMAELNMWELIAKIRERQNMLSPELSNFSPMSKGHSLIDPKLEMFFRVNGGIK